MNFATNPMAAKKNSSAWTQYWLSHEAATQTLVRGASSTVSWRSLETWAICIAYSTVAFTSAS